MADSFQNEIPKARVNISLDVETYGAKRKVELPHKALVIGAASANRIASISMPTTSNR
jgi:type VI secretion system protein ImpB